MGHQPSGIDFALIGHQSQWPGIDFFVNTIRREEGLPTLPRETIKDLYPFIPPRALFSIALRSTTGRTIQGVYIESFIPPGDDDPAHLYANLHRVKEACHCAARLGSPITALGGLTSIVLETAAPSFRQPDGHFFTTGNTLTSAFIVKSIEAACRHTSRPLATSTLLVIGSTGDIGSACVRYFTRKVKKLLLHARRPDPLHNQFIDLLSQGQPASYSTQLEHLLPEASIVIAAASSSIGTQKIASLLPRHAFVCDAGYPFNLAGTFGHRLPIYPGGLGRLPFDFTTDPPWFRNFYRPAGQRLVHGCLLEAIVLALEKKQQAYSSGRGNITIPAMEEIFQLAATHGITPALPLND